MGVFGGFQTHNHQSIGEGGSLPDPDTERAAPSVFATTSTTDVLVTGSALTPTIRDGRYALLIVKATTICSLASIAKLSIYKDGSPLTDASVHLNTSTGFDPVSFYALDGPMVGDQTPTYDLRVKTSGGTFQVYEGGPSAVDNATVAVMEVGRP